MGSGRREAKDKINHKKVIFFSVNKYFLSFGSAKAWADAASSLLAFPA